MQHFDNRSEPIEQFGIALFEFVKRLCLFLEYMKDRIGGVTGINLGGERVVVKIFASLLGVLRQGSIEKRIKVGGCGGCIGRR
jgi:hypothetical protein